MVAGAGAWRRLHLAKQRGHLRGLQQPAERTEPWQAMVEAMRSSRSVSVSTVSLSAISSARSRINWPTLVSPSMDGVSRTATARAETLDAEAEARERFCMRGEALGVLLRKSTSRAEAASARHGTRMHRLLQRLVNKTLVGRVLVDDDKGIPGLRDDVVLVHLRTGRAQLGAEQRLARRSCASARVRPCGRAGIEGSLDAFAKPYVEGAVGRTGRLEADRGCAEGGIVDTVAVGGAGMPIGRRTGAESAGEPCRAGGRGAYAGGGERLLDRADDQPAHEAWITETYVGLGRVDVDVDQCRVERRKSTDTAWRSRGSTSAKAPRTAPISACRAPDGR